ncbi:MAG: hypothetical protein ACAH20_07210, partial [Methylobacteriaceae bacterium]
PDAGYEAESALDAVRRAAAPVQADEVSEPDTVLDADEAALQVAAPFKLRTPSETEQAIVAWGRTARQYAASRLSTLPEPDMSHLDEAAEAWLRGLTKAECQRALDFTPRRLSDHMLGMHLIQGLPQCLKRPAWMAPMELDAHDGELYDAVRADLAVDPSLVPGYRVAA